MPFANALIVDQLTDIGTIDGEFGTWPRPLPRPRLPHACLFDGNRLPPDRSAWLVQLSPDHSCNIFVHDMIQQTHGSAPAYGDYRGGVEIGFMKRTVPNPVMPAVYVGAGTPIGDAIRP